MSKSSKTRFPQDDLAAMLTPEPSRLLRRGQAPEAPVEEHTDDPPDDLEEGLRPSDFASLLDIDVAETPVRKRGLGKRTDSVRVEPIWEPKQRLEPFVSVDDADDEAPAQSNGHDDASRTGDEDEGGETGQFDLEDWDPSGDEAGDTHGHGEFASDEDDLEDEVAISAQPFYSSDEHISDPDDVSDPGYGEPIHDRPVPRISIQAFCEDPRNGMIVQRASEDRRLAKAHITVHMGGMQAAIEFFRDTPTPNLVFIEVTGSRSAIYAHLENLSRVCDPGTKVVLIGQVNDISLYRGLMRQGVSEYLVPPLSVPQIIDTISALYIDPDSPPIGRCVSVIGTKGGCGSSTIAHNLAWVLAEMMLEDVTLVDLDLPFGTAALDFNQDPLQGVADALSAPERLDEQLLERLLIRCTERLSLFAAPGALDREYNLDPEAYETVLDMVRTSVPMMVVDLPNAWETWTRRVILQSDEIVVVTMPDLASLRNAKNLVDLLRTARPNDGDPKLVVNQVGVPKRPEIPVKDFAEALKLDPALVLPFDPQTFGAAANNGQVVTELKPDARAAVGFKQLAALISQREIEPKTVTPIQAFLQKLTKRK